MTRGWSPQTRKRADRDHHRKKSARRQRRHLERIKDRAELRRIDTGHRFG